MIHLGTLIYKIISKMMSILNEYAYDSTLFRVVLND